MESRQTRKTPQETVRACDASQIKPGSSKSRAPRSTAGKTDDKQCYRKDALTGLHGQRYLCRAIDACLEQSRTHKITATLALLQLENFYEIRSWVGLSEADLLLSDIAQLLKSSLPKGVLLCRCHNYEFAALLIADCSVNSRLITDKLKQALLSAVTPSLPRQLELKCGVGLAKLEPNIPSWPVVFARARHNLSLAHHHKELPAHLASISPEVALGQLLSVLRQRELKLNFQATIDLSEGPIRLYELRCTLAQHRQSLPTRLLFETAVKNALGEQLDRRILEQGLRHLTESPSPAGRLIVNLSHNSIVSIEFLLFLEQRLTENRSLAAQLILQISETDALIAQHHLIPFCEVVEKLGCKLCVSNFGCTPKPMRYLSLVPACYVKLDVGLIEKIDVNQTKLEFLGKLIAELHQKRIRVIAPMLEQLRVLPLLFKANVDFLQGNCLHTPADSMNYTFFKTQTLCFPEQR
jgi:multidomain signaling protein FimX